MSKENTNLDLSLVPPHSFHLQSLPAVEESLDDDINLDLSLAPPPHQSLHRRQLQLPPPPPPPPAVQQSLEFSYIPNPYFQRPYNNFFEPNNGQKLVSQETQREEEITPLHPWKKSTATAEVQTLNYLLSKNINMISGEVVCTKCKKKENLEYKLTEKFEEVCKYIKEIDLKQLQDRKALVECKMRPKLGFCGLCRTDTLKPVIGEKNEEINWLFLMLGQMLGCCSLDQLKYFCDWNRQPRRNYYNKVRLVFIAYVVICNQLDPTLDFQL